MYSIYHILSYSHLTDFALRVPTGSFEHLEKKLQEVIFEAVQSNWQALGYASPELRTGPQCWQIAHGFEAVGNQFRKNERIFATYHSFEV